MEEFKKRLTEFARTQYNMGQNRFEDYCEINRGTINAIKIQGPTALIIYKISHKCPELNLNWLFRGEEGGNMLVGEPVGALEKHISSPVPIVDVHNNAINIGNWAELGEIMEKAIMKAMEGKK